MKVLVFLFLLLSTNLYSQQKITRSFTFEGNTFEYSTYRFDEIVNALKFYVILEKEGEENSPLDMCSQDPYRRLFIFQMPSGFDKEKQERLFLELVIRITNRTKLLESEMIVIAPDDCTALYREIASKGNHPKHGFLNNINTMHIYSDYTKICDLIE